MAASKENLLWDLESKRPVKGLSRLSVEYLSMPLNAAQRSRKKEKAKQK